VLEASSAWGLTTDESEGSGEDNDGGDDDAACRSGSGESSVDLGRGLRSPALTTVACEGGCIRVYLEGELMFMRAVCDCGHGDCTRQRSCLESKHTPKRLRQGRPFGELVAWLEHGRSLAVHGKRAHQKYKPSATTRAEAREKSKALTNADVALTYERDQRRGEPEEPPDSRRGRGR
jgi:hypothetical protein